MTAGISFFKAVTKHIKWIRTFSYHCHLIFSSATLSCVWKHKHGCRLFDCLRRKGKILSQSEKKIYINKGLFGVFFQQSEFITDQCEKNHPLRKLQCTDCTQPLNSPHYKLTSSLLADFVKHGWTAPLKAFSSKADIFWTVNPLIFEKNNDIHFRTHRSGGWVQAHPGLKTLEIAQADLSCINFPEFLYRLSKAVVQTQHDRREFTAVVGSPCIVRWCGPASSWHDELWLEEQRQNREKYARNKLYFHHLNCNTVRQRIMWVIKQGCSWQEWVKYVFLLSTLPSING